ncbi:TPA: glycosyltransferase family 1 protein [Candidatus Berkelbacteria bacterium]|uniref:Group 1 glycosyl transferase n=1 Tax=Berkelbacteria bacterium GW2011_GWE1_39_12 TaxID=1618337 RepID=A0A0G4B5U9_9BACT|nr:MAG: group 1 glycosyl transferase [Berkelbacteria bacterium GW2011_GWE1_39_12]HBO60141.1 glycosyltransferase family 1 protein [Candidatus Berkelbacteria bacterium]
MTIGIDTSRAVKEHLTGTEYYSIELIKSFMKLDKEDRFLLYSPKDPRPNLGHLPENFHTKIMPFPKFWSQVRLSIEMLSNKPDVLFVPAHLVPIIHPKNTVTTIHDLGFKHFPELYPAKELLYHNWGMNFSVKHAKKIITVSEYTKKDLLETYNIEPTKIDVVWSGVDLERFKPDETVKKKPYILFIGRLEEKKNIVNMIKAYAFLRKEQHVTHQLVLAGSPGFGYENIQKEIEGLPAEIQKDIIQTGYISEEEYIKRLREADIFLFCTNFEGFGFPVIEAMATGTPVVASNVTSIPEIAGNAAMLVNPKKPIEIGAALSRLINNKGLKKSFILKGRVRSKIFTWEQTGQKTLEIIKKASQ